MPSPQAVRSPNSRPLQSLLNTMCTRRQLLALALGAFLALAAVATPSKAQDEYYDEDEAGEDYDEGDGSADEADVVVLTTKNFDATIKAHKYVLVEFYAPWCGHCKQLAPEYARAATAIKALEEDIVIAKVDATEQKELGDRFEIKGFPTLKWFVDGEATEYGGGRDEKTIVSWVKKKTGPPAVTISSTEEWEKATASADVVVLGYFTAFEGADFDAFIKLAQADERLSFVQTTDAKVAAAQGLTAPGFAVYKNYAFEEASTATSEGGEGLEEFVKLAAMPLTVPFSEETTDIIFESGIEQQMMFIGDTEMLEGDAIESFKTVAAELKGKLVFVTVNSDVKAAEPVLEFFGITEETPRPVVMGFSISDGQGKKFKLPTEYNLENTRAFGQAMADGTATPDYKSEPIPENNKDGEVTVVVGKSFEDIVLDSEKDVLLEVYAPWCGHCKQLEPIYHKLAKRFKKVDSVVIAKMDGTANEHAQVTAEGFPTILFYPAGGEVVSFDGERTLTGMTKFIKQHAVKPYELPKKKKGDEESGHDEL